LRSQLRVVVKFNAALHPNSPIAEEAELWAEGLVQRGSIPAQTYSKLAELAKNAREPIL
jgi:hypothetical protein